MQLSRNLLGLIHIYSEDNRAKYLLVMRGNVYLAVHVMFAVKRLTIRRSRSDMTADVFFLIVGTAPGFKHFFVSFSETA